MTFRLFPNYSSANNSARNEEINPVSQHRVTETLADVTAGAAATYSYYLDMATFRKAAFQFQMDTTGTASLVITMEGSLQDDGTSPSDVARDYQDITNDIFSVANITSGSGAGATEDMWLAEEKLACFKWIKIKVVAAGAADADWTIYSSRLY